MEGRAGFCRLTPDTSPGEGSYGIKSHKFVPLDTLEINFFLNVFTYRMEKEHPQVLIHDTM